MSEASEKLQPGWSTYEDDAGEWRWRYVSPHNGNILADSGEGYENEADAEAGIEAVQLAGAVAVAANQPAPEPIGAKLGHIGPELPDPLPSKSEAAAALAAAQRRFSVADANLNHASEKNAELYATQYVEQKQALQLAVAVVEAVNAPAEPDDE